MDKRKSSPTLFSKDRQPAPENRRGGQKAPRFAKEMKKFFEDPANAEHLDGAETFEEWLVYKAMRGDKDCLSAVIHQRIPSRRATMEPVKLEGWEDANTPTAQAELIYTAVAVGDIAPDVGKMLVDMLGAMVSIDEITILKDRLDELEKKLGQE